MPLRPRAPRYVVPMIVACALFMEHMDATVIATALPTIARDFGESPLRLSLAITCYLLSLGVFLPLSGWLADRFGARNVLASAIVVFTAGSLACSAAHSLPELVLARVLQGVGGAMMVPVGRLVVLRAIPKAELVSAMAWLTVPALLGPVTGPPLGGFIATWLDWRWIFWINIPIGLLGIALTWRFVPNAREPRGEPLDLLGFAIVGAGLAAAMLGFENAGRGVLPGAAVAALVGAGLALLALYARHARRAAAPILDVSLLRVRTFGAAVLGGFVFRMGIGALPFLMPLMLQEGFGKSAFASGSITCASAVGALTMKLSAAPILRRFGFRRVLLVNTLLCAVSVSVCTLFRPETPAAWIVATLLVGGFFRSLHFTSLNTLAYADVPERAMSRATTLASVGQQLSLTFGVGLGALILHATLAAGGETALGPASFWPAFLATASLCLASLVFFVPLARDAGAALTAPRAAEAGRAA